MDKLILQTLEKHIEDLSHESPQGIDIDSIDQLKYELTNLFSLHIVSYRREQLEAFVKQIKEDNELTEEINFQDINKFLASNCS